MGQAFRAGRARLVLWPRRPGQIEPGGGTGLGEQFPAREGECRARLRLGAEWQKRLKEMIPSYGKSLGKDAALAQQIRDYTSEVLHLHQFA